MGCRIAQIGLTRLPVADRLLPAPAGRLGRRIAQMGATAALILAWGTGSVWAADRTSAQSLHQTGLKRYWQADLPLRHGDSAVAAHLLDTHLYVVTRLGEVHAVDPDLGLMRWTRSVAGRGNQVFRPSHMFTADGNAAVVVTHAGGADVYERDSGDRLAELVEMWPTGSAAVGDAWSLYAGSSDGHVYAVQWYNPRHCRPFRAWKVLGGGPVTATPLLIDEVLIFASQGGGVFACAADRNKNLKWHHATEAPIVADLYGDESGVYVAGLDRSLYRLDLLSGDVIWRERFPRPLRDAPAVSQRTVYQYCAGAGLYAINVDTQELLWRRSEAVGFVSRRADRTCVLSSEDHVSVLDSTTGRALGRVPLAPGSVVARNLEGLSFYTVSPEGVVDCYTSGDVRHLRAEDLLRGLSAHDGDTEAEAAADASNPRQARGLDDDPLRSSADE